MLLLINSWYNVPGSHLPLASHKCNSGHVPLAVPSPAFPLTVQSEHKTIKHVKAFYSCVPYILISVDMLLMIHTCIETAYLCKI